MLSNRVEIRLAAHQFICDYWWPVAKWVQGISIWLSILETITHLAITSNIRGDGWQVVRGLQAE